MPQSGFTPIQLYHSSTASAVPSAGNLVDGELALNQADKKLYAKDSGGVVFTLASADAVSNAVYKTTTTGSAILPTGTTAQRDGSPAVGYFRYNTTTTQFEGYNGTAWGGIGGGATGAGTDATFVENEMDITQSFTIGQGGQAACTVSIATPAVVTQANTYVAGQRVFLRTTGALPTGLVANQGYYVSATGLTASSFQLSATLGGASIATSGTQSGTHTCGKLKSAESVGPMHIAGGAAVTVPGGAKWVVS